MSDEIEKGWIFKTNIQGKTKRRSLCTLPYLHNSTTPPHLTPEIMLLLILYYGFLSS